MISFLLGVDGLANTRFVMSPLHETVCSLRALDDPGRYPLHAGWRRAALRALPPDDVRVLLSLVGHQHSLPDFLTPRPTAFAPSFEDQLAAVRATPPETVRRDLLLTHAPRPLPAPLRRAVADGEAPVRELVEELCALLLRHWRTAVEPYWSRMRLVLEADITYRARLLATGGAHGLFSALHPNLRWRGARERVDGHISHTLHIDQMISRHSVTVGGEGLLLVPTVFAFKPCSPVSPEDPPVLNYPSRGIATLWEREPAPESVPPSLAALLGAARARLLGMLDDPLPTVEIARRLDVTPSAVSQHLRVLHASGLVTRARDGRHVLYRRSELGDGLARVG
ncbi:helix-turn-helix domain-containing protein [Streptomyces sp. NPDC048172]|uniref:ArsR/SmtB family transcription factor n=1 Tax=Streptomyces sp. NPDC048172 TaxID=3365505 RepID=UPI00370FFDAB